MMARGEVALIVTNKGIEAGIIPGDLMIMTVMLILFSSILTPVLLKQFFRGHTEDGPQLVPDTLSAGVAYPGDAPSDALQPESGGADTNGRDINDTSEER